MSLSSYIAAAKIAACIAVAGALFIGGCRYGQKDIKQDVADAEKVAALAALSEANKIIETERAKAKEAEAIAATYEQEKRDAEQKAADVAAGVRSGSLELQQRWAGCETQRLSAAVASASEPDAGAEDRAASAGRIVQAAADADAQIRGLQALVKADRQ